jgi:tRNA(fMet)-specific endonuclease VapC
VKYLLDTDTLIFWLKGKSQIEAKARFFGLEQLAYSTISHAELHFGAYNSQYIEKNLLAINLIEQKLRLLDFDKRAAELFGKIKAQLKRQGNLVLDADMMIASIAISNHLILVTNNSRHFQRISDLKLENWVEDETIN